MSIDKCYIIVAKLAGQLKNFFYENGSKSDFFLGMYEMIEVRALRDMDPNMRHDQNFRKCFFNLKKDLSSLRPLDVRNIIKLILCLLSCLGISTFLVLVEIWYQKINVRHKQTRYRTVRLLHFACN